MNHYFPVSQMTWTYLYNLRHETEYTLIGKAFFASKLCNSLTSTLLNFLLVSSSNILLYFFQSHELCSCIRVSKVGSVYFLSVGQDSDG